MEKPTCEGCANFEPKDIEKRADEGLSSLALLRRLDVVTAENNRLIERLRESEAHRDMWRENHSKIEKLLVVAEEEAKHWREKHGRLRKNLERAITDDLPHPDGQTEQNPCK